MADAKDIQRLEKQVTELSAALAHLATPDDWRHLLVIIHKPGWTTIAELAFASAILTSLQGHTNALLELKSQLMKGSQAIVAK